MTWKYKDLLSLFYVPFLVRFKGQNGVLIFPEGLVNYADIKSLWSDKTLRNTCREFPHIYE